MQKAPEQKNSISSSVYGIQQLLQIHALGVVNLDKVRHQFLQYINDIRSTCSQFETEVLGDVVKMGAGADPAFRKHLTHLKEQAQLESTVMRVKNILHDTKCAVENALNERETSKSKVQTRKLEKLAQSMGLMVFVDASQRNDAGMPITTITLGGTVIVVDIDIDEAGTVLKCKVTYVSEELQEDQDDRVDQLLARNLHAQDYDLFKRNLEALALLDQLNVKHTPTDFFLITRGLLADLKSIFNQELLLLSNDIASILMEGHGVPNQHLDYPGISISYWINKELVLGNDWNEALESITRGENHPSFSLASKVLISFEDSQKPNYFIPPVRKNYLLDFDESQSSIKEGEQGNHLEVVAEPSCPAFMQPMRFVKMLSSYPNISPVPVRFVAKLDPPIPAADSIIRKLMVITGTLSEGM
ncbi:mediator of RNA polymerase II transcription subunit 1-domain-containing protein [Dichotomocladium elegans]|nr:mediator of RNA polymerase II transcription subunit 1-domain-containing protein [Dichotomocladium elegans]